ncbi:MAG TPA: DUF1858 domain-containing protein [Desulfuromonadales bacterium]|nr:DUF1858 domain-containing protein [Desulfuromonadales bacterium]
MIQKITPDMTLHQILKMGPQVAEVLRNYNLGCIGCMGAVNETLAQGALAHGLDVQDLLRDLNALFAD